MGMKKLKPMKIAKMSFAVKDAIELGSYKRELKKLKDYNYSKLDNVITFNVMGKQGIVQVFKIDVRDFDWILLWDKLGDIPINEAEELEESFQMFDAGIDNTEVWQWFEEFFDISLGKELFS